MNDVFLLLLAILEVAESLLLEVPVQEQALDFFELILQVRKFLVVVLLDGGYFLADVAELVDLVLNLVLELTYFILEVVYL